MNKEKTLALASKYLGAQSENASDAALLNDAYNLCVHFAEPKQVYRAFDLVKGDELTLADCDVSLKGDAISKHLHGAKSALLVAFTLGARIDKELRVLSVTTLPLAVAFDAVCSAYTEVLADELLEEYSHELEAQGLYLNFRFCPGYGDLPLDTNVAILTALDAIKKAGIVPTDDGLLVPRKSMVGVCGVFDKKQEKFDKCELCGMRDNCKYKEKGERCGK